MRPASWPAEMAQGNGKAVTLPSIDDTCLAIKPWLKGFIRKEYGNHVHSDDLLDLEQEGFTSIVNWVTNSRTGFDRFHSVEEYFFYAKQIARNAIRDYTLKYNARFSISLFKLRRVLKQMAAEEGYIKNPHRQRLGDYMHRLGSEYSDRINGEDPEVVAAIREQRLDILSHMSDPDITDSERRAILKHMVREFRREQDIRSPYSRPLPIIVSQPPVLVGERLAIPNPDVKPKLCTNRLCTLTLNVETMIVSMGFGYCTAECLKSWPPVVNRIQREFDAPIDVVLAISMKLFRSRRKSAEVIGISPTTMSKLVSKFARQTEKLERADAHTHP